MQQIQTTQTTTLDDASLARVMAAMESFMTADFVDDIAANVAREPAKHDAHMKQAA